MKNSLLVSAVIVFAIASSALCKTDAMTDLNAAIEAAKPEQKALFIMYGRQACGNCQALRSLIDKKAVRLPKTDFVIVEINCDDPAQSKEFRSRYTVSGNALPFVVIAKSDGTQLASRSGYGAAAKFNEFIRDARKDLK